jgi:hypothetical protein
LSTSDWPIRATAEPSVRLTLANSLTGFSYTR